MTHLDYLLSRKPKPRRQPCISGTALCGWNLKGRRPKTFTCPMCNAERCYCHGCADDMPAVCDSCWYRIEFDE